MKNTKHLIIFSCLFLVFGTVFAAGCLNSAGPDDSSNNSTTVPPIMDASLYRGTVTWISTVGDQRLVTLEQTKGTNFGAAEMEFLITDSTDMRFNISEIQTNRYLEVYYAPPDSADDNAAQAIAVNLLPDAGKCVYNGVLREITPPSADSSGVFTLELNNNETVMEFLYDSETQFYLTFQDLQTGDMLNIYAPEPVTQSETGQPQTVASEVRLYQ